MFDVKEFENNHKIQMLFKSGQLPEVPLFEMKVYKKIMAPPEKQQFFFYEGRWRNTDPRSELGSVTFSEHEIRSTAFVAGIKPEPKI